MLCLLFVAGIRAVSLHAERVMSLDGPVDQPETR